MLINFTIALDALRLSNYDDVKKEDIISHLARSWMKVGLLISYQTSHGTCAIADQARLLPQHMRKEWGTLLLTAEKKSRCVRRDIVFQDGLNDLLVRLRTHVDLIYVGKEDADSCGIPSGRASIIEPDCEICRVDCNGSSVGIQKALRASSGTIQKGADVSMVWKTLLQPLARQHRKFTVVDRYAVKNKVGLIRLFEELNMLEEDKYLVIFSGYNSLGLEDSKKVVRDALKRLNPGSLREVELYLAPDDAFQREAHHRYIHFANDCCFQCDTGLEILENQKVYRNAPYQFVAAELNLVGCESKLRQHVLTKKELFTRGHGLSRQIALPPPPLVASV